VRGAGPEETPARPFLPTPMSRAQESPGTRLRTLWARLAPLPGGRWLFSRLLGRMVPYSGTLRARVERFEPGEAVVSLGDRRTVRNHLRSVHAIALANLGELCSGLAVLGGLGPDVRGILTRIDVRYLKKARGRLVAEARCTIPTVQGNVDQVVEATIRDADATVVATVDAHWRLSPVPRPS
jgi:acyl-coenzyme A thioesterase PaaI-like protein